ncbi:hypothetical protein [Candidatus Contendibacter odensensis]|uniref:Uncharacterized protein n=1 Tax=Candidatus Contendobacter odensis Run_B_J11 TaxID=1400861 RepID=A0A7U7J352_9GAMM|nr:hypothetical protein [Candidatus Contendobacter odensis]CDH43858.1 exported hypothetical protein [Candidatus Contendobacter odensis Run_B_J11]
MKRLALVIALVGMVCGSIQAHSADAPPTKQQIAQCVELAKNEYIWKDKESVRADDASWNKPNDKGVQDMNIAINAKNSYGAYVGAKYAMCGVYKGKPYSIIIFGTDYHEMMRLELIRKLKEQPPRAYLSPRKEKIAPRVIFTQPTRPATPDKDIFFKPE